MRVHSCRLLCRLLHKETCIKRLLSSRVIVERWDYLQTPNTVFNPESSPHL